MPGEVIDISPSGRGPDDAKTEALFKTEGLEVIRLVLAEGREVPAHEAPGPITVQCIEGRVEFTAHGVTRILGQGQMLFLKAGEPHSLRAATRSAVLVTLCLAPARSGSGA
jgi:quercetin dioxygenase-like cupin family protein